MEARSVLRTYFRFDTYKVVRSDTGMGNEYLSKVLKIAQDNLALTCNILTLHYLQVQLFGL